MGSVESLQLKTAIPPLQNISIVNGPLSKTRREKKRIPPDRKNSWMTDSHGPCFGGQIIYKTETQAKRVPIQLINKCFLWEKEWTRTQLSQESKNTESTTPDPSGLGISATTIYQPSTIITIYPPSTNIIYLPTVQVNVGTRWENSYHILFPKGR